MIEGAPSRLQGSHNTLIPKPTPTGEKKWRMLTGKKALVCCGYRQRRCAQLRAPDPSFPDPSFPAAAPHVRRRSQGVTLVVLFGEGHRVW